MYRQLEDWEFLGGPLKGEIHVAVYTQDDPMGAPLCGMTRLEATAEGGNIFGWAVRDRVTCSTCQLLIQVAEANQLHPMDGNMREKLAELMK